MHWDEPYRPPRNRPLEPELYANPGRVVFLTIRAYRSQSPFVRDDLKRTVLEVLREEQEWRACAVFTHCLMPHHLHILVSARQAGVAVLEFANRFKGKATTRSWSVGWRGRLWQPRYYDHVVRADERLRAIAEYILSNPIHRNLVERPEDWQWSGHMNPLPL